MEVRAPALSLALPVCLLAGVEVGKVQVLQVEPVRGRDLLLVRMAPSAAPEGDPSSREEAAAAVFHPSAGAGAAT